MKSLNMGCPCTCILGQLFGRYTVGLSTLGIELEDGRNAEPEAVELGLESFSGMGYDYVQLTDEWLEALS